MSSMTVHRGWKGLAWATVLVAAMVGFGATLATAQTPIPADPKNSCPVSAPTFAGWFKSGVVTANGEVNPADSVAFPDTPNCSFYEWSEQMFLWLTSPTPRTYGGGGGRIFNSPAFFDVSAPDGNGDRKLIPHKANLKRIFSLRAAQFGPHGLPVVFDKKGRMLEVLSGPVAPSGNNLLRDKAGAMIEIGEVRGKVGARAQFLDKAGKSVTFDPKAFFSPEMEARAQDKSDSRRMKHALLNLRELDKTKFVRRFRLGDRFVFFDQNGNTIEVEQGQAGGGGVLMAQNGSLVYYASMVNDVYAYLLTGTKNGGITPTPTQFPRTQAELDKIVDFAALHGRTFPDPEALAIEVKSAWIEATNLDASKFITLKATVPTYDTSSNTQWVPNGEKDVTLALVGMHVVGSTKGHAEMIWGTFEHIDNTPNAQYAYTNAANATTPVAQNTAGTWLFSASNSAGPFNVERMHFVSPNIVANAGKTIGPSDIIRWKAWGAAADHAPNPLVSTAGSNAQIISINNSVRGQLLAGDVRKNYYFTGSTWTIGGAAPSGANEVGTSMMANTTMETFQQGTSNQFGNGNNGTNCFSCHVTNEFAVSHFFEDLLPLF